MSVCRYQKEAAVNHLSPVKKRVKENTPPQKEEEEESTLDSDRSIWTASKKSTAMKPETGVDQIITLDSPSPSVSRVTLSTDSEEERASLLTDMMHPDGHDPILLGDESAETIIKSGGKPS